MRLFLDECISPRIAKTLAAKYACYVIHPRNNGGLGDSDHTIVKRCTKDNLVIMTMNAKDFRVLAMGADIHPGMIILPCVDRKASELLISIAIAYLQRLGDPGDVIVNHVLEIDQNGKIEMFSLPGD